jgi:Fic family protein
LLRLFEEDRQAVRKHRCGSIYQQAAAQSNLVVFEHLREKMMLTIPETVTACGLSKPTVARALKDLIALGIASELTGAKRNRVFLYDRYLQILNADVEAP